MKEIRHHHLNLPDEVPIMVLPQATLFTRALLPLYIFELRYRAMLRTALETDRMFCIAMMRPGVNEAFSENDFFHVAGLGLIRACVGNPDGTSHLLLEGLARVQFVDFVQEKPFCVARIRELHSTEDSPEDLEPYFESVLEKVKVLQRQSLGTESSVDVPFSKLRDPEVLSDLIAHRFITDPMKRQELLEELNVRSRLRLLLKHLDSE
jgi:Lon protease-like protein